MRFALALAALALAGCSRTPPCENDTMAYVMAKDIIERQLGPSAKVASITEAQIAPTTFADGQCGFAIRVPVDGQNVFGGPVRQWAVAQIEPDATGNNWSMRGLNFFDR